MSADKVEAQPYHPTVEKSETGMNGLQFTASLTASLAWPVAAVIIAVIFHRQIASLLKRISGLSWGEAKVNFGKELDKIEAQTRQLPNEREPVEIDEDAPETIRFEKLLAISPNAAIIDAWGEVENVLYARAFGFGIKYLPPHEQIEVRLAQSDLLDKVSLNIARELRQIRNAAAHNRNVTITDAYRFRAYSRLLEQAISAADTALGSSN